MQRVKPPVSGLYSIFQASSSRASDSTSTASTSATVAEEEQDEADTTNSVERSSPSLPCTLAQVSKELTVPEQSAGTTDAHHHHQQQQQQQAPKSTSRRTLSLNDIEINEGASRPTQSPSALASTSSLNDLTTSYMRLHQVEALDSDEDEVIIVSTGRRRSLANKPKVRSKSGRDVPVIVIPDSPPRKGKSNSFASLGKLQYRQRAKGKANEPRAPRWPTCDEHCQRVLDPREYCQGSQKRWSEDVQNHGIEDSPSGSSWKRSDTTDPLRAPQEARNFVSQSGSVRTTPSETLPHVEMDPFPHPLLARIAQTSATPRATRKVPISAELWTTKYSPATSDEILGQSSHQGARLLKDWLAQLALSDGPNPSKRRRPVIREVEPKKRRRRYADSDLDDFLASSDEDNDEENNAGWRSEGDQSEYRSIPHTLHESVTTKAFVNLANLMLLTGPHASGKTSSVYAVAHELDWDVFEVNPSSKRNAKDLERSVGDVSKNHLVRKDASSTLSPTKKAPRGDIFSMMRAASGSRASHRPEAFKALPIAPSASSEQTTNPTKQSLILLDEVDVLFGDEENFWTGVINLARESHRPIIMTCTDLSTIPFSQLGLQLVKTSNDGPVPYISFEAPEKAIVSTLLRVIAHSEGFELNKAQAARLYSSRLHIPAHLTWRLGGPSDPLPHINIASHKSQPDLRQALLQLQFEGSLVSDANLESGSCDRFRNRQQSVIDVDSMSFADAYLSIPHTGLGQIDEPVISPWDSLRELGPEPMHIITSDRQGICDLDICEQIMHFAEAASHASLEDGSMPLREARSACVEDAATVLSHGIFSESSALGGTYASTFTDYLPFIRQISAAEDLLDSLRGEGAFIPTGSPQVRRSTRLSKTEQPTRRFNWNPQQARAVAASAFPAA